MKNHYHIATLGVRSSTKSFAVLGLKDNNFSIVSNYILFSPYIKSYEKNSITRYISLLKYVSYSPKKALISFYLKTIKIRYSSFNILIKTLSNTIKLSTKAMTDFFIKKGDTLPRIESSLKYSTNISVNLTNASRVDFIYKANENGQITIRQGIVVNALEGKVAYDWTEGDTVTVGTYKAEWKITFLDGKVLTIPNDGTYINFVIVPTLS